MSGDFESQPLFLSLLVAENTAQTTSRNAALTFFAYLSEKKLQ